MDEYGRVVEPGAVRFERLLPGPIERVWACLTESDKRARWLAAGPMDLRVGGRVQLNFRHEDLSRQVAPTPERFRKGDGGGGTAAGVVTRCDPPRLLAHTWGEEYGLDSEVTYELHAQGDGVLLVLTHRRLDLGAMLLEVAGGWHTHLDILVDHLNGREPRAFWTAYADFEAEYRERFGADA